MKRISILILGGILVVSGAFSQQANLQSAKNYLGDDKLVLAKKFIDLAIADPGTSQEAETWEVKGAIYETIYEDTIKRSIAPDALDEAFTAFKQATVLDTKKKYTELVQRNMVELRVDLYNIGIRDIIKNDYTNAQPNFVKALAVSNYLNANYGVHDLDTLSMYHVAICDLNIKKLDSAKILFQQLSDYSYNSSQEYSTMPHDAYTALINAELGLKDTAAALASLSKAMQALPKDESFILTRLNISLAQRKYDEAINGLLNAIKFEPNNPGFYYDVAICYKEKGDIPNAEASYKKAIELKPDYPDAEYSLGVLYYNEGVAIDKQRQNLPLGDKNYDKMGLKSDSLYKMSIPEFEKANQEQPKDMATLRALNAVYTRTKQDDKVAEIKKEIDALQGK